MSMHILRFGDTGQHNECEEDAHACAPQLELRSHHFLCTVRQVTCQLHAGSKDRNGTYQIPSLKDLLLPKVRMSLRWAMVKHRIKWCCCPYVSSRHHWVPSLALVSLGNLHLTHRSPCCVSHLPCSVWCLTESRYMAHLNLYSRSERERRCRDRRCWKRLSVLLLLLTQQELFLCLLFLLPWTWTSTIWVLVPFDLPQCRKSEAQQIKI